MEVYLVRHAESRQNVGDPENHPYSPLVKDYEDGDFSITARGEKQADLTGQCLSKVDFDYAFCSPLHRHVATMNGILRHQKNCKRVELLIDLFEKGIHSYSGMPTEILSQLYPDIEIVPCPNPTPTGGKYSYSLEEMYDMIELRKRARRVERYLTSRFLGKEKILIVSSGDFIGRFLTSALLRLPDQVIDKATSFGAANCSVARFTLHEGGIRSGCHYLNDTSHLKGI